MSTIALLTVSKESINAKGLASGVINSLFPELAARFAGFVGQKQASISNHELFLTNFNQTEAKALSERPYTSLRTKEAFIPPGLQVTYKEQLSNLEISSGISVSIIEQYIRPFRDWVDEMVTNPKSLARLSAHSIPKVGKDYDDVMKRFNKAHSPSLRSASTTVDKVILRSRDWLEVEARLNSLMSEAGMPTRELIISEMNGLNNALTRLITLIRDDTNGTYKASKTTLNTIADGALAVGKYLELYVYHIFSLSSLNTAVTDTVASLKK